MSALRPTLAKVFLRAEAVLAAQESAATAPAVLWSRIGESPQSFAIRVEAARGRVLAVVPAGFSVPAAVTPVELPAALHALLHPSRKARYRIAYGGRGAGKSHAIARALIVRAVSSPARTLCAREIQHSIRESVHRLLADTVTRLGLARWFDVGVATIRSHTGAEFIFEGLFANQNKIRSLENVSTCWVEEAAKVSEASWEILIPTVRAPGSEFLINFNPESEDDPTWRRFVVAQPPATLVEHVTYADNPFFPPELEAEREYLQRVDPDAHAHIWLGLPRALSDAQVFKGKYCVEEFTPGPGWDGPYLGADWGFAQDPTVLVRAWIAERTLYIEHEAYGIGVDIDKTPELFDRVPDARKYVIRADSARPETVSYMRAHGYPRVESVSKWPGSVEDGVAHLRQYERIVVHPRCAHTADEMRLYSYKVDRLTSDVLPDLVDAHNHVIDALRYALSPLIRLPPGQGFVTFMREKVEAHRAQQSQAATTPAAPDVPRFGYFANGEIRQTNGRRTAVPYRARDL